MTTLVDKLIGQLDTLVAFLALSEQDVFQVLKEHRLTWFAGRTEALPDAYTSYRKQVNHSAFLLGYSYFESFLHELLAEILRSRHELIPGKKKLDYSEILESPDISALIDKLVRRELYDLFIQSMEKIVPELRKSYHFTISEQEETELIRASLLRNCIMHNSSRADARLARYTDFMEGDGFELTARDVHHYGITVRHIAPRMFDEACGRHKVDTEGVDGPA